jgi:glycerate dehydrogenase
MITRHIRIVVLDQHGLNSGDLGWDGLEDLGRVTAYDFTPPEQVAKRIGAAEAIFINKTLISRELLDQCPKIRFVGVLATGFDVIDLAAAAQRNIVVTNIPTYGTASVAQFATALLLELCHRVGQHDENVRNGGWAERDRWCYWLNPLVELSGKTLGIVGFGRIGQAFGHIGQALGMRILAHDAFQNQKLKNETLHYVAMEELYREADVISLHCPLTDANCGMINRLTIEQMKPTAFLINTSRGRLVVEEDLAAALNHGRIAGAAMDVLVVEPPMANNPLLGARNCIITPHMAWGTVEARRRIIQIAEDNLRSFLAGTPKNMVTPAS